MIPQRKKRNSSKVNLTISFIFHGLLILVVFFFAAREGLVGKKLKQLAVTMVPKEKKPAEPPKEKAAEPKAEQAKTDQAPKAAAPQPKVETAAAPPPAAGDTVPSVAPALESARVRIRRRRKGSANHFRHERRLQRTHPAYPPLALEPPGGHRGRNLCRRSRAGLGRKGQGDGLPLA